MTNSKKSDQKRSPMTASRLERRVLAYVARYLTSTIRLEQFIQRLLTRWQDAGGEIKVTQEEISTLLNKSVLRGYVDDQRFAELRLARWYRAGHPQRLMQQKLRAEQLDDDTIQAAFTAFHAAHTDSPQEMDFEAGLHYARKRSLGPYRRKERSAWRDRDIAKMGRRGFNRDVAYAIIDYQDDEKSYN